jgi:DNA (cytosine-5)-methyltransferase 1
MRHGSLFSGIGGFDLASEWMGWENVFHCEWNEFGKKVLNYYWPKAITYHDITKTDFSIHRGTIDILTGGFPCQPYSQAGKRLGKEDDRHLWPEMLRAIREIQPTWVVGENVSGLTNWNGGLVFDEVQTDLEAEGYQVTPFLLPACAVDAPHRRDRIWFVAHSKGNDNRKQTGKDNGRRENEQGRETKVWTEPKRYGNNRTSPNPESESSQWDELKQREFSEQKQGEFGGNGCGMGNGNIADPQRIGSPRKEYRQEKPGFNPETFKSCGWSNFPTQSPVHNGNDGFSSQLDGITFPKWRNESIKAGGNAIVPQVVYQIFKAIHHYEITRITDQ